MDKARKADIPDPLGNASMFGNRVFRILYMSGITAERVTGWNRQGLQAPAMEEPYGE
jgi:hypothetical protein